MGFSHVQNAAAGGSATTSFTKALSNPPGAGNLVCVTVGSVTALTGLGVKDAANNVYTLTPHSPANNGGTLLAYHFYFLIAANAAASITASWTSPTSVAFVDLMIDEFSVTGGTQAFDTDVTGTGTSNASTGNISSPSITPAGSGELLYSSVVPNSTVTAPANGATLGAWTGGAVDTNGPSSEYVLSSASGATAVNYTDSVHSDAFAAMISAFKLNIPLVYQDDSVPQFQPAPFDPIVSVW